MTQWRGHSHSAHKMMQHHTIVRRHSRHAYHSSIRHSLLFTHSRTSLNRKGREGWKGPPLTLWGISKQFDCLSLHGHMVHTCNLNCNNNVMGQSDQHSGHQLTIHTWDTAKYTNLAAASGRRRSLVCEEGQSTLTETSARQTCLSHAGIREPNLSHDYASGEARA